MPIDDLRSVLPDGTVVIMESTAKGAGDYWDGLRDENAKLRAALQPFSDHYRWCTDQRKLVKDPRLSMHHHRAAAIALGDIKE